MTYASMTKAQLIATLEERDATIEERDARIMCAIVAYRELKAASKKVKAPRAGTLSREAFIAQLEERKAAKAAAH